MMISEQQMENLIKNYINPHEAYNDVDSVKTVCDGKRGIAFVSEGGISEFEQIVELVSDHDLGSIKVPNSKHDAYVIFNRDFIADAKELAHIAKLNDGYLPSEGDERTIRRIGELLSYDPDEVEQFIRNLNGTT